MTRLERAWLWLLPLLFLPNIGGARATPVGELDTNDLILGPYFLLLYLAGRHVPRLRRDPLTEPLLLFLAVASFSSLTIAWRYPDASEVAILTSLFKVAKLSAYALAGFLTVQLTARLRCLASLDWAILGAAVVLSLRFLGTSEGVFLASTVGDEAFKEENAASVYLAILLVYLAGRWLTGTQSKIWASTALTLTPVLVLALLISKGRGGWFAGLVGLLVLAASGQRSGFRLKLAIGLIALVSIAFLTQETFRTDLLRTISPDRVLLDNYNVGVAGVDDGARLYSWTNEAKKYVEAPILGTGIFHRTGASPLWWTGSHNFWLQMVLETGALGGLCLVHLFYRMRSVARFAGRQLAQSFSACLAAIFIGGTSGEYFYGGAGVLVIFLAFSPASFHQSIAIPRTPPVPLGKRVDSRDLTHSAFAPRPRYH